MYLSFIVLPAWVDVLQATRIECKWLCRLSYVSKRFQCVSCNQCFCEAPHGADDVDSTAMESAFSRRCPSMSAGVDAGSEAALEEVAERLGFALADHGCRGTPACEGLSGATKVRVAFAAE